MKRVAVLIVGLLSLIPAWADEPRQPSDQELVGALRQGGYVLFVRHPSTNPDQADTDPLNLDNIRAQRQLSEEGRRQAKALGDALRALKVPVDKVIASKFQRAVEAAKLMDVGPVETSTDVTEGGLVVSPNENKRRAKALAKLLATAPAEGKNTVIVSHKPNLEDAAGKEFGDLGEAEVVIFQPLGEKGFRLVRRVPSPATWAEWAR